MRCSLCCVLIRGMLAFQGACLARGEDLMYILRAKAPFASTAAGLQAAAMNCHPSCENDYEP